MCPAAPAAVSPSAAAAVPPPAAAAAVHLLLLSTCCCRSTSRGLHFWEVVPLDVLLGQLAAEGQAGGAGGSVIAQKLHQLLVPSYFPGPDEGVVSVAWVILLHEQQG
jgi:hypothetical protein